MTQTTTTVTSELTLNQHLANLGITVATIIDDAYDTPSRASFVGDELELFWGAIERDDQLVRSLSKLADAEVTAPESLSDEVIKKLWDKRGDGLELSRHAEDLLFRAPMERLSDVEELATHLAELGLRVERLGSGDGLPCAEATLVFLDYYLGVRNDGGAVEVSTNKAQAIYRQSADDAGKPFIVLMSSSPDADAAKENFRKASGLLAGLFGYVAKDDLREKEKLRIRLTTWALGMPARHDIQRFIEAMEHSFSVASTEFVARLRGLALEDYVSIQWLSLLPDGHPLGDYMVWLYKSLLAHLLHGNDRVIAQQRELDKMAFDNFLPCQGRPSLQLAELYRCAVTDPGVGDVAPHPRAAVESQEPYLRQGDLFVCPRSKDVLLVINAACDLAYSPGTKRKFPGEHTIILARGTFQPLDEDPKPNCVRTEPFAHDGHVVRIVWNPKRFIGHDYEHVWAWLKEAGFRRITRLNIAYALEIQQAFASNLTRVGLPVRPPGWHADVELLCGGDDGTTRLLGLTIRDGAFIVRRELDGKERNQFVLTVDCITTIISRLDDAIVEYRQQQQGLAKEIAAIAATDCSNKTKLAVQCREGQLKGLNGKLEKLEQLKASSLVWMPILQTLQPLPFRGNHIEIDSKLLWVWHDGPFSAKFPSGPPVAVNVRVMLSEPTTTDDVETPPASAATDLLAAEAGLAGPSAITGNVEKVGSERSMASGSPGNLSYDEAK
jgi:hypothetical protein